MFMYNIYCWLFYVCVLQSDVVSKVGARHAIVDTIKVLLDRAYPALTDTTFITLLVKKVKELESCVDHVATHTLQVSEQFTAVDMDLSEDSVDLEEATVNGIQLLNVSVMYILYVLFVFLECHKWFVYVCVSVTVIYSST